MKYHSENGSCFLENTYCSLPQPFYSDTAVSVFPSPKLLLFNEDLAKDLGIANIMLQYTDEEKAGIFSGNVMLDGTRPIAQAYAGHQFGYFNILGDGRAKLLGEWVSPKNIRYDIQLKGSGITAYSRGGDGKAALSPMLREYLISEAMNALGIPTTRSLALTFTGEHIYRSSGYTPGAVLTRIAKSHIRVGTFQFARILSENAVRSLADYAIERHYPELKQRPDSRNGNIYLGFLEKIIEGQAALIAQWQSAGFIHGVMNTDNMSISGETVDYGPCAFMDIYNPQTVFSSIDSLGRYSYENQNAMAKWNLARLAEALMPIIDENEQTALGLVTEKLSLFDTAYEREYSIRMKRKLGLSPDDTTDTGGKNVINGLLTLMEKNTADFTNTFLRLTMAVGDINAAYLEGTEQLFSDPDFFEWTKNWKHRLGLSVKNRNTVYEAMKKSNPFIIPRNHITESVLSAFETGNSLPFSNFFTALKTPYDYDISAEQFQKPNPNPHYKTFCGT